MCPIRLRGWKGRTAFCGCGLVLVFVLALAGAWAAADEEGAQPQGILIGPDRSELAVALWTEKPDYLAGERLRVHVRLNRAAYLYLYDINAQGEVTLLFPNGYDRSNRLEPGEHLFPDRRYSFVIQGPPGLEVLQAVAVERPIGIFSLAPEEPTAEEPFVALSPAPQELAAQVQALLAEVIAEGAQWAAAWTSFRIVTPRPQRLLIVSYPGEAEIYVDGEFIGLTPEELELRAPARAGRVARVELTLVKEGFEVWSGVLQLEPQGEHTRATIASQTPGTRIRMRPRGETQYLEVHLAPAPQPGLPPAPGGPSRLPWGFEGRPLALSLGVNLGGHPQGLITWGTELGVGAPGGVGVRLGGALADTAQDVPDFYDVGEPTDLGPERVYNDGPELELYAKLAVALPGGGLALELELGAGVVVQRQAHLAALTPELDSLSRPQDVGVLPNGYRTERVRGTALIGLALRVGPALLQWGYDAHRGWVGGLGLVF